jgi:hypothetical protein
MNWYELGTSIKIRLFGAIKVYKNVVLKDLSKLKNENLSKNFSDVQTGYQVLAAFGAEIFQLRHEKLLSCQPDLEATILPPENGGKLDSSADKNGGKLD